MTELLKSMILAWAAVFLQTSLAPNFGFGGIIPDLVALAIAAKAIKDGPAKGTVFGAWAGFLSDCYHPATMGLLTLGGLVSGWTVGIVREGIYKEQPLSQAALAAWAALIMRSFEFLGQGRGTLAAFPWFLLRWGLGGALYTALLSLLVMAGLISWLGQRPRSRLD